VAGKTVPDGGAFCRSQAARPTPRFSRSSTNKTLGPICSHNERLQPTSSNASSHFGASLQDRPRKTYGASRPPIAILAWQGGTDPQVEICLLCDMFRLSRARTFERLPRRPLLVTQEGTSREITRHTDHRPVSSPNQMSPGTYPPIEIILVHYCYYWSHPGICRGSSVPPRAFGRSPPPSVHPRPLAFERASPCPRRAPWAGHRLCLGSSPTRDRLASARGLTRGQPEYLFLLFMHRNPFPYRSIRAGAGS
jgi:hypothetical protein